jgi:N-acetylglucosamine kinase-like BadF-type ATPase
VVGDVISAFAAGTPSPSGAVLIAGTGAIAALVDRHQIVRTADGFGWLLGDLGSGRWMGLQALRAAVRDWSSPLARAVAAHAEVETADDLIRWAQTPPLPLASIGSLAPVVCDCCRAGEPAAAAIVREAVAHLLATLDEVGSSGPVVLGGSLLSCATPVRDGVLEALRQRDVTAHLSHDPAAAAAWLAASPLAGLTPAELHARLLP